MFILVADRLAEGIAEFVDDDDALKMDRGKVGNK